MTILESGIIVLGCYLFTSLLVPLCPI